MENEFTENILSFVVFVSEQEMKINLKNEPDLTIIFMKFLWLFCGCWLANKSLRVFLFYSEMINDLIDID